MEDGSVLVEEYENPQSEFTTKGISLVEEAPQVQDVLTDRNAFIRVLLNLYEEPPADHARRDPGAGRT